MSDITEAGWVGEKTIRDYLTKHGHHYMQVDILVKVNNKWYLLEIKHQEIFSPPPFYGHGLPKWQVDARLNFQKDTGIRAMIFIVDKISQVIYWQYVDVLMSGDKFQTRGDKPRIIFPITSYEVLAKDKSLDSLLK